MAGMASERCSDRRPGRWRAAIALSALVLAGCGAGGSGPDNAAPVNSGARLQAQEPASGGRSAASLPEELVGSWSADDPQGVGSWTIAFSADGRYDQSNPLRGISVGGQAAVAGRKLYLQPENADSQTYVWQITGERLRLDDHVYRRTVGVADALVGSWAGASGGVATLTFNSDGTYDVADATGSVSHSTYSVAGDRLSAGRSTYTWSVAGAQLQLRLPDGRVLTYSRTA
jgi:hypothetical protein